MDSLRNDLYLIDCANKVTVEYLLMIEIINLVI